MITRYSESDLVTRHGRFRIVIYLDTNSKVEHIALVSGEPAGREGVPVRVHSECITSEAFGSLRCDCKTQLDNALEAIATNGVGILVYLRQEGRGIGLGNKIRAYALQQERGLDTVDANLELGFEEDLRSYDVAAAILGDLHPASIDLITNNPKKIDGLKNEGVNVRQRIPSRTDPTSQNRSYLQTKRDRSGHLIDLLAEGPSKAVGG